MDDIPNKSQFAACIQVFRLTLRRQFLSRQTIVIGVLLFLALTITAIWAVPKPWNPDPRTGEQLAEQILSPLFMGFLLPLISLGYASSVISGERTGQTLVYLLSTSIPRPQMYLSQFAAVLLLTLGITLGCLASLCVSIGMDGVAVLREFVPVVALATVCYVALFLLFSGLIRRATFLALAYALMIETLTANIPGVVKRITVSFYANSWLYDSSKLGLEPNIPAYDPVTGATAIGVLIAASLGFLVLGMWLFSRKEYE
ncbi:MAG: ABC transporter permease subunit [Verrucomicrobiota bacterium]|nr:ABC transporter permease subunit [Verrucomicrobiota bacterium]